MPLFKFECTACHHTFEQMMAKETSTVKCPKCGAAECKKLIGNIATKSSSEGSCSVNKRRS